MSTFASDVPTLNRADAAWIQEHTDRVVQELLASLPSADRLSREQRRGIIARYTAVLEGNFIYWMTGAYLSVASEQSRSIIVENLHEEVSDCHPGMLRKFALAASAAPTDLDARAVYRDLLNVRLFVGRLAPLPLVTMMAFFEGFIQKFMAYLADLAQRQGSTEQEYTDVHGVCDVAHSRELYRALEAEMALANGAGEHENLYEGVYLLKTLMQRVITG